MRNSAVSIATKKASAPPPRPSQKVDCYRLFEEFEKRVTKLCLPENWQINSSSNYYRVIKHDTIHDIPIFDIYIGNNLEFTIRVFAVYIPANDEIYTKFSKSVKNITSSNLVPKIFNPKVATSSTFTKFYRSTSCSYICKTNICTNCQKFENQKTSYVQESIKNKRQ